MKRYSSDLHIGHRRVSEIRGYGTTTQHDNYIAHIWDTTVKEEDQVWLLGDMCLGDPSAMLRWVAARPGTKHLVWGNHDEGHPSRTKSHIWQKKYLAVFDSVQPFAVHKFSGVRVALSHFPYDIDRHEEVRDLQWRLRNLGMPLMHGHLHSADKITSPLELHIGWDSWGKFITEDEIVTTLEGMNIL